MAVGVYISTLNGEACFVAAVDAMAVAAIVAPETREKRIRVVVVVGRRRGWKRRGRSIGGARDGPADRRRG